jgi:hypothetical protein
VLLERIRLMAIVLEITLALFDSVDSPA